jgi:sporulation integral membrane protein YlbJ
MRPLFRVSGTCAAAVAMGFVGGYPVGARTALQLYQQGQCSKTEAERLLSFCNNSGPAFILGVVGAGVFGSGRVGLLLYLTHAAASLLVGILFRFYGGKEEQKKATAPRPAIQTVRAATAFTGAVVKALQSTLNICAFVVFFSVVLRLLSTYGVLAGAAHFLALFGVGEEWARRLVAGLLELSSGVSSLAGTGQEGVSMAAFMLGWAGLSVHCQVLSFLGDSGLSVRTYLAGKLCHGLIAAALTWAVTRLFPLSAPVSAYLAEQAESIAALDLSTALSVSLVTAFALWAATVLLCGRVLKKNYGKTPHHRI